MSLFTSLAFSILTFLAPSPAAPSAPAQNLSIGDLVALSGGKFDRNPLDADILINAIQAAGLFDALDDDNADLTLFAPNDLAFILLARNLGYSEFDEEGAWLFLVDALTQLGGGDPIPLLTAVLTYHVSPGAKSGLEVILSSEIETLNGAVIRPFYFILRDEDPDLVDPMVTFPFDVDGSNGTVHVISRVLLPIDL